MTLSVPTPAPAFADTLDRIRAQIAERIVGQTEVIDEVLVAFLARGHVLLEGVPGTAKTLLVRTLAETLGARFGRIQFTPDLMPSDITGVSVFGEGTRTFEFRPGPVFTDLLLADEITARRPRRRRRCSRRCRNGR
ncbi:MAG TPA: AAA family ATPase [Gemmatimonadaceae bacterium]|nr:AAA family ATPase [Gemmatimonadaceae bacterium]